MNHMTKPATPELRRCVLNHKLGHMNLPKFTGVPSPDDMAYEPTDDGYKITYLYHHQAVAETNVDIATYMVYDNVVVLHGTTSTWALEEGGERGYQESPLCMRLPVAHFDGMNI